MKKFLALLLAVALTAGISVAGTVAYLTSEDSDVNVMTVGRAKISQTEWQRAEGVAFDAEASKDADTLVPFVQGQPLLPAVPVNGAATDYTAAPGTSGDESTMTEMFKWGDYTSATLDGNGLWYDSKLKNTMDKFVFVENTGSVDVYFRTIIAYECPEGLTFGDAVRDSIGANVNGAYDWEGIGYMTIDNVRYAVAVGTYNDSRLNGEILKPGETARPSLLQVAMNHEMGNEEVSKLGDTYEILVLSQAVQASGFDTAAAALEEGFGEVSEENVQKWFGGVSVNDGVVDDETAKDALTQDKETIVVNLSGDVVYDVAAWQNNAMGGESTKNIIINGNGNTITFNNTNSDWNNIVTGDAVLTINNATVTNSGHDATSGTWNGHDIVFADKVVLNDVVFENAIALMDDATLNNVSITDDSSSDAYGIWIRPNGQTVTIDGLKMDMTTSDGIDRGIKIDNQYSENKDLGVTLTVKNAEIKTEKKAAILVKSTGSVTITTENITFTGAISDIVNVDSDTASNAANILHNGAAAPVEQ